VTIAGPPESFEIRAMEKGKQPGEPPQNPFVLVLALAVLLATCSFAIANLPRITAKFAPQATGDFLEISVKD
jgi:hypothetical protein